MDHLIDETVASEDLKKFEMIYNKEVESGSVSTSTQFDYAWCLVRSRYAADIRKGISLLESLFTKTTSEEQKRDFIFFLTVGHAKLKEYQKALHYIKSFLQIEPGNQQAQNLEAAIKKRMEKEGLVGAALAGGIVLAVGGLITLGFAMAKK